MPTITERPDRRWLSQAEAAVRLGVTDRTIRTYIARGALRASRIRGSRLVRIDSRELDAILTPIPSAVDGGRVD